MRKRGWQLAASLLLLLPSLTAHATIEHFEHVSPWIYRGAQPMTDADYDHLVQLGVKSIINFRQFTYVQDLEERRWKAANDRAGKTGYFFLHPFTALLPPDKDDLLEILQLMTTQELLPAFVHCESGVDRTGLVVGLYQMHVLHWTYERARDNMKRVGASAKWLPMWWALHEYSDWDVLTSNGVPWSE